MSWKTAQAAAQTLHGARVLVVEDEPLIALELQAALAERGAQVVGPFCDAAAGLAHAASDDLAAALLDVRLGETSVGPLARALSDRGVPFAFYTGQTEYDLVCREWPAAPVPQKPSPTRQLLAAIERLCAG